MKTIKAKVHWVPTNKPEEWWKEHYITTDEEIKKGDKVLGVETNKVYDAPFDMASSDKIRKIIATTDPKILGKSKITETKNVIMHSVFPSIPQSFIEECYMSGGIDEVLVEYEEEDRYAYSGDIRYYPKLDSNNTIIIHPVEEEQLEKRLAEINEKIN